jgi:hypothetical protein
MGLKEEIGNLIVIHKRVNNMNYIKEYAELDYTP